MLCCDWVKHRLANPKPLNRVRIAHSCSYHKWRGLISGVQVTDGYVGCAGRLKNIVQTKTVSTYVPGTRICGAVYGSDAWKSNTCCNPSSNLSQCCPAADLPIDLNSTSLDSTKTEAVCLTTSILRALHTAWMCQQQKTLTLIQIVLFILSIRQLNLCCLRLAG
jgi:hypothetical protein